MIFFSHSSRIRILQLTFALVCSCSEGLLTTEKHHLAPFCLLIFCFICLSIQIKHFFFLFFSFLFISFAIPKYNNDNYYHKAYMHKRTTHLSTRAIPQSPHKVCLLLFYKCYSKKKKLIIFVKEEKLTRLQSPFVH